MNNTSTVKPTSNILSRIVLLTAISLSLTVAFFSVTGLGALFGMSAGVLVMGALLELGKLVSVAVLHLKWNMIGKLKWLVILTVSILMLITSAGVFGYLSKSFEATGGKLELESKLEIQNLQSQKSAEYFKIGSLRASASQKQLQIDNLTKIQSTTTSSNKGPQSNISRNNTKIYIQGDNALKRLTEAQDSILGEILSHTDSINSIDLRITQAQTMASTEIGSMQFIGAVFGIPGRTVIQWLIIALVLCLDPLAVMLLITFVKSTNEPIEVIDSTRSISQNLNEISQVLDQLDKRLEEELANTKQISETTPAVIQAVKEKHVDDRKPSQANQQQTFKKKPSSDYSVQLTNRRKEK